MKFRPGAKLDPSQVNWGPGGYPARQRYREALARRNAFFQARNQALSVIWSWGYKHPPLYDPLRQPPRRRRRRR